MPAEAERILASAKRRRRADGEPDLTPEEEARLEALVADNYLGSGDEGERAAGPTEEEPTGVTARTRPPAITIEVSWGDVTKIEADVYAVGHYQGVLPQNAELALDCAVSGIPELRPRSLPPRHHAAHPARDSPWRARRRGLLPVVRRKARAACRHRRHGAPRHLRPPRARTPDSRALPLTGAAGARTVCTVLIGSGAGTLSVREAVRARAWDERGSSRGRLGPDEHRRYADRALVVVEWERSRAFEVHAALQSELGNRRPDSEVELRLEEQVTTGTGGASRLKKGSPSLSSRL